MKYAAVCACLLTSSAFAQTVTLDVALDADTATALATRGEKIVVSAWFNGEPAPGSAIATDEMGLVFLSTEDFTLWPVNQTLVIGSSLAAAPVAEVVTPRVNVNVYSARHAAEDNLLDCSLVDDEVAVLAAAPQKITCTLLD